MQTSIDLRRFCEPDTGSELHFLASGIASKQIIKQKNMDFWDLAKQYQANVEREVTNRTKVGWYPKIKLPKPDLSKTDKKEETEEKKVDIGLLGCLTNIGYIDCEESYGKLKLHNLLYTVSNQEGMWGYVVSVSTFKGKILNVNTTYAESVYDKDMIERSMDHFVANVKEMLKE